MKKINSKSYLFVAVFFILFGFVISITPTKTEAHWCEHYRGCNDVYNYNTFNGNTITYNGNFSTFTGGLNTNFNGGGRANTPSY